MKRGGKERDEYIQRMEAAVANAHTAMKVLKEENLRLNEQVRSLQKQIEGYEKEKRLPETPILKPAVQSIEKQPIRTSSGIAPPNSRLISFARPIFSSDKKETRVEMLSTTTVKKSDVNPPLAVNPKRMR
jgi:hypothetical protein